MKLRILGIGILLVLFPMPGAGQVDASLDEVEALMGQGRILEAREVLEAWWEARGSQVGRMERQRSLWLRARLTVDPSLSDLDLRRLVLEFPGGPYSDDALLRLAESADLRGDLRQAHTNYTALLRGYPSSPLVPVAEEWLVRKGPEVQALGPEADPGGVPATARSGTEEEGGPLSVQVGAFRSLEGARSLSERVRDAGYFPRLVRVQGTDLFRVRVGRFEERGGAESLKRELERAGFEATIVTDAQSEERVG
ncbi:MAG: SPOR domain-containing protein [Longimicrobiales bacterium]